ncbi:MAG TPA: hypothetical protein VFG05_02175 [Methylocella sp.]|nr:hypothetical protein [Methylocella sp.]
MSDAFKSDIALRCALYPNDLDRRRIERALKERKLYRYVVPKLRTAECGYHIESPCCSRNIDPEGGIIDVALLQYNLEGAAWRLYRKNHSCGIWELHSRHERLPDALELLKSDPAREFWQ